MRLKQPIHTNCKVKRKMEIVKNAQKTALKKADITKKMCKTIKRGEIAEFGTWVAIYKCRSIERNKIRSSGTAGRFGECLLQRIKRRGNYGINKRTHRSFYEG